MVKRYGRFLALREQAAAYQFELNFGPLHALNAAMVTRGRIRPPWPDLSYDLDPDSGGNYPASVCVQVVSKAGK